MAMQTIQGLDLLGPRRPTNWTVSSSATTFQLNLLSKSVCVVAQATSTVVWDTFQFRLGTITTGNAAGLTVEIWTVDATNGRPSAKLANTNTATINTTAGTGVYTASGLAGTGVFVAGTFYCINIICGAVGDCLVTLGYGGTASAGNTPYHVTFDAVTTYTKSSCVSGVGFAIGDTGPAWRHIEGICGTGLPAAVGTYSNATNPNERGLRFTLTTKRRLIGVGCVLTLNTATTSTFQMRAWQTPSTSASLLTSMDISPDPDIVRASASAFLGYWLFGATAVLSPSTEYGVSFYALSTGTLNTYGETFAAAADLDALYDQQFEYMTRNGNSGNFTLVGTQWPYMWPICDQGDDGAGGSGGDIATRRQLGM